MKCFSRGCRILLLLLSFILTLQEVYADTADNATSSNGANEGQSNSETATKTKTGSLIVDKISNLVKSIENLALFRAKKYDDSQKEKQSSEALALYTRGGNDIDETRLKDPFNGLLSLKINGENRK